MSIEDTKNLLDSIATTLSSLKSILVPSVNDEIIKLLELLYTDSSTISLLASIVRIGIPSMTDDMFKNDVKSLIDTFEVIKKMVQSGDIDSMERFCKEIQHRPVILAVISKLL
jgi:hypothetical protein